jgi:predicted metal-dependent peptidase
MYNRCDTEFNLERHLIVFLQESPFYAELSRHIRKTPTKGLPTAGVTFNKETDELVLLWNPDFFEGLSNSEIKGVLLHEFNHLIFGHLADRRREPHRTWNIATDLAINSLIYASMGAKSEDRPLPKEGLVPGQRPHMDPEMLAKAPPDQRAAYEQFADLIASFPTLQTSEWYHFKLLEEAKKNGGDDEKSKSMRQLLGTEPGDIEIIIGGDSMDDHSGWDKIPEEMRPYVEGRIKAVLEKAVNHADGQANGWGNMPASMQAEIRRSVSNIINWRSVLRQFVGSLTRGERSTSIKRINRRYPYVHPGVKRGYTARLAIAIDQSGSVDDGQLNAFFAELSSLTKRTTVDIIPFDCQLDPKDIFEWKKGTNPKLQRVRGGGTDFNAPTRWVNDAKNRGKWDGLLILTDGEAPSPEVSRVKRGWVLSKDHKLIFDTTELQVFMDDSVPMSGAWR